MHQTPMVVRCILLCASLAPVCGGCLHHTQYEPKEPGAYLAITDSRRGVIVRGAKYRGTEMAAPFRCDTEAESFAGVAQRNWQSSQRNEQLAGVFSGLSVLAPPLAFVAFPFAIIAENSKRRAMASMVDAVNRYNDAPPCLERSEDPR